MRFNGAIGARPTRLPEYIRDFAADSFAGKYGDEAMTQYSLELTAEEIEGLSATELYDKGLMHLCKNAPIRICPYETVSGSANLGLGIDHAMPITVNGRAIVGSICHVTLDYDRAVNEGIDSYEKRIRESMEIPGRTQDELRFLKSLQNVIDGMHIWHSRYLAELKKLNHPVSEYFENVPFSKPSSFKEALQSLWFCFAFTRFLGNWPGIGRIDKILGPYLEADLKSGAITRDEARLLLAGFFVKGCEWIRSKGAMISGDAQHYQNLVLGGLNEYGNDTVNDVSYLILDVLEELPIGDFPVSVRLSDKTPEEFKKRVAEVIRYGGGVLAVYNERQVLKTLCEYGYPEKEALRYANDGCWEVQIPGETCFIYHPFDCLKILLDDTLGLGKDSLPTYETFDELKNDYFEKLAGFAARYTEQSCIADRFVKNSDGEYVHRLTTEAHPCSAASLLENDCIGRAKGYFSGGTEYMIVSPHIGGVPDAANSLYALKKLVYDEKKLTLSELLTLLKNNWEGGEALRAYAFNKLDYYGSGDCEKDGAGDLAAQILSCFASAVLEVDKKAPLMTPPGVSTFGRQIEWAPSRKAVPFGKYAGDILSGNLSPTPGTDHDGATAVIAAYGNLPHTKLAGSSALDVSLIPDTVKGDNGVEVILSLLDGFLETNGFFMQLDVADANVLREAQKNPESYRSLSVRVSGWNARFITLDKHWQDMVIQRIEGGVN